MHARKGPQSQAHRLKETGLSKETVDCHCALCRLWYIGVNIPDKKYVIHRNGQLTHAIMYATPPISDLCKSRNE